MKIEMYLKIIIFLILSTGLLFLWLRDLNQTAIAEATVPVLNVDTNAEEERFIVKLPSNLEKIESDNENLFIYSDFSSINFNQIYVTVQINPGIINEEMILDQNYCSSHVGLVANTFIKNPNSRGILVDDIKLNDEENRCEIKFESFNADTEIEYESQFHEQYIWWGGPDEFVLDISTNRNDLDVREIVESFSLIN